MNELTKKILKAMGLTDAEISAMDGDSPTAAEADITSKIAAHQRTLLENDSEFLKPIRDKAKTEIHTSYEKALKKFGVVLTVEDAAKKSAEEKIKLLADKASEGKDATLTDLESKLMAANQELQTLKDVEIPKIRGEVDAQKSSMKVREKLIKEILKITEDGKNLRNPIEVVESTLGLEFGNKYKIELDDKGESLVFKNSDGTLVKNAAGTGLLKPEEILKESLGRNKFLAESNADEGIDPLTGKKKVVTPTPGKEGQEGEQKPVLNVKGLSKAEEHLASMKKAADEKKNPPAKQ